MERHLTFVEAVLARPTMYTLSGSYGEVVAFLEGYFSGAATNPTPYYRYDTWFGFADSLRARYGVGDSRGALKAFYEQHGVDSLAELRKAFAEFVSAGEAE